MNRLVSHIEFLLHEYNCVIIPDFGGFVVNTVHSRSEGGSVFHTPTCELVFNRDLTYNDGLMAQSYMKAYELTYELATLEIQKGVRELKHRLHDHRQVELGRLGTLTIQEDERFVYKRAPFIRPAFFGLTKTKLRPLTVKEHLTVVKPSTVSGPKVVVRSSGTVAAAVAIIALMLLIFPVSDTATGRQSARMLSETEWFRTTDAGQRQPETTSGAVASSEIAAKDESNSREFLDADVAESLAALTEGESSVSGGNPALPTYYIVMGVFKGNETAQKMTRELQAEGFSRTGRLERAGRIDVYAASFEDEKAAKTYLREIHGRYPAYADAWILKR